MNKKDKKKFIDDLKKIAKRHTMRATIKKYEKSYGRNFSQYINNLNQIKTLQNC